MVKEQIIILVALIVASVAVGVFIWKRRKRNMADKYIQIDSNHGVVLIDDAYNNYRLAGVYKLSNYITKVSHFHRVITQGSPGNTFSYKSRADVSIQTGQQGIYVISNKTNNEIGIISVNYRTDGADFIIFTQNIPHEQLKDVYVYFYVLGASNDGNYGVQCFNENGTIVFNSNDKYLEPICWSETASIFKCNIGVHITALGAWTDYYDGGDGDVYPEHFLYIVGLTSNKARGILGRNEGSGRPVRPGGGANVFSPNYDDLDYLIVNTEGI